MTENPDITPGAPDAMDQGVDIPTSELGNQFDEKTRQLREGAALQMFRKSTARAMQNTNTVYLDLHHDTLKMATVKVMDPRERCMVTPDTPDSCLVEELRSGKPGELPKLLQYHLEMVEFKDSLPFNVMLRVAHTTTILFQKTSAPGPKFSSLPFRLKGLKPIKHQQKSSLPSLQRGRRSRFSRTTIQDCSTDLVRERGIRVLHFHVDSSEHDWQCFVNLNSPEYMSEFGGGGQSVFENIMAATLELFETGQTLHERRPFRTGLINPFEAIARAKYFQEVERKRITLDSWGQYLAEVAARAGINMTSLPVLHPDQSGLHILSEMQKKECSTMEGEGHFPEKNAGTSSEGMSTNGKIEPVNGPVIKEVESSDKIKDGSGEGGTSNAGGRDMWDGEDMSVNKPSTNSRKKRKGKGRHHGLKTTLDLACTQAGQSKEEEHADALTKSWFLANSKPNSRVNVEKKPDPALYPTYGEAPQCSSRNANIINLTASLPEEVAEMDDLRDHTSAMSLERDEECLDVDGPPSFSAGKLSYDHKVQFSQSDLEQGHDDGWQTVAHGKKRKSLDRNPALLAPSRRRGVPATMFTATNRASAARGDRRIQDLVIPKASSTNYATSAATTKLALDDEEFPDLPTMGQSDEAAKKVIARRKKKKDKQKKRKVTGDSSSSQSTSQHGEVGVANPTQADQQITLSPPSQLLGDAVEQGSQETLDRSSEKATNFTDDDVTPNASMINLVEASARQLGSPSAPPSAGASQSGATPALTSASTRQPHPTFARLPATSPQEPWVYKFGALEGGTRIVCNKPGCDKTTTPWDGSTVICPSCGPYSTIRYCCIEHLLGDTTDHWGVDCMKFTCHHYCDASTIHPRQVQCPPAIPNLCGWNTPERHRQSVYHAHSSRKNESAEVEGDYFIFTDFEQWLQAGAPDMPAWGSGRARGAVLLVVTFDHQRSRNSLKDRFNRLLNIALFTGASNAVMLNYMFLMIRENLISKGEWSEDLLNSLVYQFQWEFCYQLPDWVTNNLRHACPHQWFGTPPDRCLDRVCNAQMLHPSTRHLLFPRFAIKEKADELERRYWILRVARVYHPNVLDPRRRMRGVGFSFVPLENRKMFCMGREWDGYPSGTMEIEGAIWVRTIGGPPCLQAADLVALTV